MARPYKLTLDFFVHKAKESSDPMMRALSRKHGNDGYATYFRFLELLCSENELRLVLKDSLVLETIAEDFRLRDGAHLCAIIETCVDLGLLDRQMWQSERIIFAPRLYNGYVDRLEERQKDAERKRRKRESDALKERLNRVVRPDEEDCPTGKPDCPGNVQRELETETDPNLNLKNSKLESETEQPFSLTVNVAIDEFEQEQELSTNNFASFPIPDLSPGEDSETTGEDQIPAAPRKTEFDASDRFQRNLIARSNRTQMFTDWWNGYEMFCFRVGADPGNQSEALEAWLDTFKSNQSALERFLEGSELYRQEKIDQFAAEGKAIGVPAAKNFIRGDKWQTAIRRKQLQSQIPTVTAAAQKTQKTSDPARILAAIQNQAKKSS